MTRDFLRTASFALLLSPARPQGVMARCTPGATACQHNCPDGTVDLSGFKAQMTASTGYFHYHDDSQTQDYYFEACGPISAVTCQGSSITTGVAAIQTWGSPSPQPPSFPSDACGVLGSFQSQQCSSSNGTFTCDYANGDGSRSVSIRYTCAPTYLPPTAGQPDPDVNPPHYIIEFKGPAACAGAAGGSGGTSWGTLFCILFPVACATYVGAGYAYNYKYREMRGVDAVPQLEYWKQVPGLVKDGCKYSYEQTNILIDYLKEKQRGGAPADAGLKAALAENEEGGASSSSTAYEEQREA